MSNFTDSRANTTAIEPAIIAADAHADTRENVVDKRHITVRVADAWWASLPARVAAKRKAEAQATYSECECDSCRAVA